MAVGISAWQLAFQLSPIILVGGLFPAWVPGVPIIAATELVSLPLSLAGNAITGGNLPATADDAFAQFMVVSGATVLDQQIATYPFANQTVAANSVIQQSARVSFQMISPARGGLGYWAKLAAFEALIQALYYHNTNGGMYHLLTPSFVYFNCLMRSMRDTSSAQTKQVQNVWTLDFEQPLLTLSAANAATQVLNQTLSNLGSGTPSGLGSNPLVVSAFNAPSGGGAASP